MSTDRKLGGGIYNIMEMRRVQRQICVHRDTGQQLGIDLACDKFEVTVLATPRFTTRDELGVSDRDRFTIM